MQSSTESPLYACVDVEGKGKGLVAVKDIPKGTRILSEVPIITTPQDEHNKNRLMAIICEQVSALTEDQRQAFLSMHNIYPYETPPEHYLAIIRTNGLPIDEDGIDGGIFLEACRMKHACDNNAQKSWNKNIERHTVHALRDIAKGEEITVFTCASSGAGPPARRLSRQNSVSIARAVSVLDGAIGAGSLAAILASPLRVLRWVDRQVRLYNEHGPDDNGLPRAFLDAAQVAIAHGDLARGRIFAERAVSGWKILGGDDSTQVREHGHLAVNPSKLGLHGLSKEWKTAVDEVPQGLEAGDFEDWLWKRE
ncbi:Uu.00g099130.m01.CDS01 [Anthostomella pinea]|uniref:Uu.00g099130.m01.CDS01 n=1 Tax=Anthostomella pinea TaxID=933095 RepID=A0AAI8VCQ9_9PEZI|nr:Uu.00g099130.m01.CDS01 [Anthostomella pinea]